MRQQQEVALELSEELRRFVDLVMRQHRDESLAAFHAVEWNEWREAKGRADGLMVLLRRIGNSIKPPEARERFMRNMESARHGLFQAIFFDAATPETEIAELRKENGMLIARLAEYQAAAEEGGGNG